MSLIIQNAAQFFAGLALYKKTVEKLSGAALFTEANLIMGEAKQITPVDTGTLRNSGFVEKPKKTSSGHEVTLGFGGPAAPYAFTVHESPESRNFNAEGTGPKYLEKPLNKAKKGMDKRIAKRIDRGLAKRGF